VGLFYNDNTHGPRNPHGADISTKRWPKTVKFGRTLDAIGLFLNISDESYTDRLFKSNAADISFMHTDVAQ